MNSEKFALLQCSEETLKKFDLQVRSKSELATLVNDTIFRKAAKSSKEKFDVLDLRDKLLKLIRFEINNQTSDEIILVGTCMDMCPEKERYNREYLNLSSKYEFINDQIDYRVMIKEYSRSSADQDLPLPNELRPIDVLYETTQYIIDEVIAKIACENSWMNEQSLGDWYDFAWNRTRAIRKEIIQQRLLLDDHKLNNNQLATVHQNEVIQKGLGGVIIIEQCARFQIFCAYRLCDQGPNVFSFKINEENLKNCFQSLRQYYGDNDDTNLVPSPNETEFRSYIILLNLKQSDIMSEILNWSAGIRNSTHVTFALAVYNAFNSKNYVRFFRLFKSTECTYLQACILHRYIFQMRCEAFKVIFSAFKDQKEKAYPLAKLTELLGFDTPDDVYDYCDIFELETDEINIIMRSNISYNCFVMSKPNQDRLTVRRSKLLVDSKFKQNSLLTNEKCLSQIIRGTLIQNNPSKFGVRPSSTHVLTTCFDENDYYFDNEINKLLAQVKPRSEMNAGTKGNLKSTILTPSKIAVRRAANLVKKAIGAKKTVPGEILGEGLKTEKKRRSSVSSNSSMESRKRSFEDKPAEGGKTIGRVQESKQSSIFTKTMSSNLFGSKPETSKVNPFTKLTTKTDNLATNIPKPLFWQSNQPAKQTAAPAKPEPSKLNLFEHLIKKNDQQDEAERLDRLLSTKAENFFQSLYLEQIKDVVNEFYQNQQATRYIPFDLTNSLIDSVVDEQIRHVYNEIIPMVKSAEQAERRKLELERQKKQDNMLQFQQANLIINEVFDSLVGSIVKENCNQFIAIRRESELIIYDDILCSVFQQEFDIILKQIANELNHELFMDKLTQTVYFNSEHGLLESSSEALEIQKDVEKIDYKSIFISDLHSFLHDCVYEWTRLNLNVNRELYHELKQAIALNEKKYMFRKWRLKLSLKLLKGVHKRKSLDQKKRQCTPTRDSTPSLVDRQLHLITFIKTYGSYMLNNLNKLQRMMDFMIGDGGIGKDLTGIGGDERNEGFGSIVHCEEFQMHLTWNARMNYSHFLYEILLENYFNIIHNRDDQVLLPAHVNHELFAKVVIVMPRLNTESDDLEALKQWLLAKFFNPKQTSHNENFFVTMLQTNAYGLKFCSKLCHTGLSEHELNAKLSRREFYGANSLVYVLMPCEDENDLDSYLHQNRMEFYRILKLFNENLNLMDPNAIDSYQFMFLSYLESHEETKKAINFILGKSNCCYCLLEGDVIKDNRLLQHTYRYFLNQVYKKSSKTYQHSMDFSHSVKLINNYEPINNVITLANILEMTVMKFFEFLAHSTKSIFVPFDALVDEYNARLDLLVRMLTKDEYRYLAWPIPELCNVDLNSLNWILKYWNTVECFDSVIRGQFLSLMYLTEDLTVCESQLQGDDDLLDLNLIETKFRTYLDKLLVSKRISGSILSPINCTKSKYQLDSSITQTFINMKKFTVNNQTQISKCDIQWAQLLTATVEYLLANGHLCFRNHNISIEQFHFYCNLSELKSYDWINNLVISTSLNSSPSSSVFSNNSEQNYSHTMPKSNYLAIKYSKRMDTLNKKRRISDEEEFIENVDASAASPVDQASLEETFLLGEMFLNNTYENSKKCAKSQRLMTPPDSEPFKNGDSKLDLKFQEFFTLLNSEKVSNEKFDAKLSTCTETSSLNGAEEGDVSISFDFLKPQCLKRVRSGEELAVVKQDDESKNFNKTLDDFLERLHEEKIKNEKFNSKLNNMLNY